MITVYALLDPRDGSAHYVGVTAQSIKRRTIAHHSSARCCAQPEPHQHRETWLKELLVNGLRAIPIALEHPTEQQAAHAEERWCSRLLQMGEPLVNSRETWGIPKIANVWTPELDAMLGVAHDADVARAAGVTRKAASYRREIIGRGPSGAPQRRVPPPPMGGWNEIALPDEVIQLLGTMPDYKLGARFKVSKFTIARARRKRGIKSYAEQTGNNGQYLPGNYPDRWLQ